MALATATATAAYTVRPLGQEHICDAGLVGLLSEGMNRRGGPRATSGIVKFAIADASTPRKDRRGYHWVVSRPDSSGRECVVFLMVIHADRGVDGPFMVRTSWSGGTTEAQRTEYGRCCMRKYRLALRGLPAKTCVALVADTSMLGYYQSLGFVLLYRNAEMRRPSGKGQGRRTCVLARVVGPRGKGGRIQLHEAESAEASPLLARLRREPCKSTLYKHLEELLRDDAMALLGGGCRTALLSNCEALVAQPLTVPVIVQHLAMLWSLEQLRRTIACTSGVRKKERLALTAPLPRQSRQGPANSW
jgi:hypothetical protein